LIYFQIKISIFNVHFVVHTFLKIYINIYQNKWGKNKQIHTASMKNNTQ